VSTRTSVGGPHSTVEAHGLRITMPPRWEARLFLREAGDAPRESTSPVLHLGNFALPPGRGDYGSGAVEAMHAAHAFVALVEFGATEADTALFAAHGMPYPRVSDFAPNALQRALPGQLGSQWFFTERGRPFCLYVVLGSRAHAPQLVREVHVALANITVSPR
jgi:hypothetical protein